MPVTFDARAEICAEIGAEIHSPVEIRLQSAVAYENPYTAIEMDAVFTHADGTVIAIPGFWREGDTWAVRFTPVKEGDWAFRVTCTDSANKGLFAEGVVHATAPTGDTALSKHGFVTVAEGGRFWQHADGTPFFWLGDTNWQAFSQVSTTVCNYPGCTCGSQFGHIVDDRIAKGFTVYQTYFVPESGNGEPSVWLEDDHTRPDTSVFNGKVDGMFDYLHERGMVIALGLGCHTSTTNRMRLDDMLRFTRYVVARYACYSIAWISGQEVNIDPTAGSKTPGYTTFDCYMAVSDLIDRLDGYRHPNSAHMFPMRADDERAKPLDRKPWHGFWTVQSGHGYVQSKEHYLSYYTPGESGRVKLFYESEANYEDINCGPFTGYDFNRMGAWKALLCGSAGYTYGTTGIWAGCFSTSVYTGWYGETTSFSYEPWYMGLDKPGSFEMGYMKTFFEAIGPWHTLTPCFGDTAKASFLGREDCVLAVTEDATLAVGYFYGRDGGEMGEILCLDSAKSYDVYWFNPRTGRYIPAEMGVTAVGGRYAVPERPDRGDWVLLVTALGLGAHEEESRLIDLNPAYAQVAPTGRRVTPVSVKAVGGISYAGTPKDAQVMTDPTARLCDGDPSTVWKPVANRATQTMIFDLGDARALTHLTITPAEGTVIPTFRAEGSNDGRGWTILADTSLREAENPGAGSEPLRGTYRYVKILLHNPKSLDVGADELGTLPYKAIFNPMTGNSYSATEIADVAIYAE